MHASARRGTGRRTKRGTLGALAILDEVLLDALRALLIEHPALEDPGHGTEGDDLHILTVAERVVERIMELRDMLDRYESARREVSQPRASPTDDDVF